MIWLRRGSLRGNTVANLAGRLVPGILTIATLPVLLPLLGTEGYGLVSLYATFQIVFATLDVGLTLTATRGVAQNVAAAEEPGANWNLARTLEVAYFAIGAAIALLGAAGA